MTTPRPGWRPLALLLAGVGVLHFAQPGPFARIVPRRLGDPYPWVYGSGVAELACAAGLAAPRTRRAAALATAALFVGVFPANVQMAVTAHRSSRASTATKVVSTARLPLQGPLVWWALDVAARSAVAGGRAHGPARLGRSGRRPRRGSGS
ncbi:DoxX family protein [Thalassiella azotivora]